MIFEHVPSGETSPTDVEMLKESSVESFQSIDPEIELGTPGPTVSLIPDQDQQAVQTKQIHVRSIVPYRRYSRKPAVNYADMIFRPVCHSMAESYAESKRHSKRACRCILADNEDWYYLKKQQGSMAGTSSESNSGQQKSSSSSSSRKPTPSSAANARRESSRLIEKKREKQVTESSTPDSEEDTSYESEDVAMDIEEEDQVLPVKAEKSNSNSSYNKIKKARKRNSGSGNRSSKRVCASCSTVTTPYWREGRGGVPLCNACGIRYKKREISCDTCGYVPRQDQIHATCPNCDGQGKFR